MDEGSGPSRGGGNPRLLARIAKLQKQARLHEELLGGLPDAVIGTDANGEVLYWSGVAETLFEYKSAEVEGHRVDPLISLDAEKAAGYRTDALHGTAQTVRLRRRSKNGRVFWSEVHFAPMLNNNGCTVGVLSTDREAADNPDSRALLEAETEQLHKRNAELEAEADERKKVRTETELFFELADEFMGIANLQGRFFRANAPFLQVVGVSTLDLADAPLSSLVHPQDRSEVERQLSLLREAPISVNFDARLRHHRGGYRRLEWNIRSVPEEHLLFATGKDVTEARQARAALQDSERRFRELAENISEVFWLASASQQRYLYVSPAYESIWGRKAGPLYDRTREWQEAVHPEDRLKLREARRRVFSESRSEVKYRVIRPDNSVRWIHDRAFPVFDREGNVERIAGIATDITDSERIQIALERLARGTAAAGSHIGFLQSLVENLGHATNASDVLLLEPPEEGVSEATVCWSNGELCDPAPVQVTGSPLAQLFEGRELMLTQAAYREFPLDHALGTREVALGLPLTDGGSAPSGALVLLRREEFEDLPVAQSILRIFAGRLSAEQGRQRSEEQLWRREADLAHVARVQTITEMGSSIAHELNQPLYAVMNHADAALIGLKNGQPPEAVFQDLEDIANQAERGAQIIQRLRGFLRKAPPERQVVDLNDIVAEVGRFMAYQLRMARVEFTQDLSSEPLEVFVDGTQVEQVLVNLIQNAIQAMAGQEGSHNHTLETRSELKEKHAEVSVIDNGPGPGVGEEGLFEAFVTSKPEGMGIGLSISRSIIESHEGHLWYSPNPAGKGSVFSFRIPLGGGPPKPDEDS